MSLSPEHQAAFQQLQTVLPGIRDALFPVVQDALIRPLWVPVALNCIALLALFATMGCMQFFSGSKLQFFKICDVRNVRLAIPTVDIYLPLAAVYSGTNLASLALTLDGAYDGRGRLQHLTGTTSSAYLPIAIALWWLSGSLLHNSSYMLHLRYPRFSQMPRPFVLVTALYVMPTLFLASALPVLIINNLKINSAIRKGQLLVRTAESNVGQPTSVEIDLLLHLLEEHVSASNATRSWNQALCIVFLIWVSGFLLVFMPTALAMAHALRKVLVMERKSGNLRTAGDMGGHKASLSPGVSVAPEKSLQLRACYRFWIVLIVLVVLWAAYFETITALIFVNAISSSGSTSRSSVVGQVASHWINGVISCAIVVVWLWKSVSAAPKRIHQRQASAKRSFADAIDLRRAPRMDPLSVSFEVSTEQHTSPEPLVIELPREEVKQGSGSADVGEDSYVEFRPAMKAF